MFPHLGTHMAPKVSASHKKNCVPEFSMLSALKLPSCGLLILIDMNRYILTEGRNFKTFLKANYAIVLYSCYLLIIKNMWNMESNMFC